MLPTSPSKTLSFISFIFLLVVIVVFGRATAVANSQSSEPLKTSAAPAGGNRYYICDCASGADGDCVAGDDNAAGTLADPWQSYDQARQTFNSMSAGDSVNFCAGGGWSLSASGGSTRWVNSACEADNRCVVSSYTPDWASGDEGRPILARANAGGIFRLEDGGNAEHEEGYLIENLDLRGFSGEDSAFFFYNDIDDVEIRNVRIDNFSLGVHLGGSNDCSADPACDGRNERITLRDSTITNNSSQGWLGASSGSQILDNYFEGNGGANIFDHNIYISGSSHSQTQGIRVAGNQLYRSSMGAGDTCLGVSLVVHGEHDYLTIEGNEVWEDVGFAGGGCWGIAVDNGYGSAEGFTNVFIRNNIVRNVGNVSIGVGACANCTIENNIIINEQDFGQTAVAAPNRPLGDGDLPQDNITVRNNTIWLDVPGGRAISVNEMGNNHVVVSNAIYYAGTSDSFDCFRADLPTSAYDAFDNNLCYFPNAAGADWTSTHSTLSGWQNGTGFGLNSLNTDPGFTNAAGEDFTAVSSSAAIVDSGHPTQSSSTEIGGGFRNTPPDMGAHEWELFLPSDFLYLPTILK